MNPPSRELTIQIEFDCPSDIFIHSQPGYYSQIFSNLLSNSVEHGFENISNGLITITVSTENKYLKIVYSDNGKSTKNICERVFEPFYSSKRGYDHSGLGMYTVFNIVQAQNGNIECHSQPENGVKYEIKIPHF